MSSSQKRTAVPKKKAAKKSTVKQRKNTGKVANLKSWKPGQSGNPKGRPKKADCLTSLLKEEIEKVDPEDKHKRTYKELVVMSTMRLAMKGNAAALKEVWERMDGKVKDKLEVMETPETSDEAILLSEVFTLEELKDFRKRIEDHQRRGSG